MDPAPRIVACTLNEGERTVVKNRQTIIGLTLTAAIVGAWLFLHIWGVHIFDLTLTNAWVILPVAAVQCWLTVGLFIIAHDAIHGSLAPARPNVNTAVGWITMTIYAGFNYRRFYGAHHDHHDHVGSADDPDFSAQHPTNFWRWYAEFMTRHFGWRPLIFVNVVVGFYWLVLGASMANIFFFYGLPSLVSSVQLFYFGTFRPHRHTSTDFADEHRARTSEFPWLPSLLTCYHFGYHHEHHLFPYEPWWRLPARRLHGSLPT